ncbi:MAG: hypothetical protein WC365_06330 [Candidatus Babeliales bacterium]|jgi:hypothetical protein
MNTTHPLIFLKKIFNFQTVHFKVLMILLVTIYLPIAFRINSNRPNITDTIPQLKALTTKELEKLGPFSVRVKVGMFIRDVPIFNIEKNNFKIDSVIWFEFNGDEITLDTLEKFSIDNGKILSKSPPDIKISENGLIFAKYNVLFELNTNLGFHHFPLENHRLSIVISNDFVTPKEMTYVVDASGFQIQSNILPAGWDIKDTYVNSGYLPLKFDPQDTSKKTENPKALFALNLVKTSSRKALIIFIPLFSASILSLLSFITGLANTFSMFTLTASAVTALLTYRFVIEQMMPTVGYSTLADTIFLFLLLFSFIVFTTQILTVRRYMAIVEEHPHARASILSRLEMLSSVLFILMCFLLVLGTTYILLI